MRVLFATLAVVIIDQVTKLAVKGFEIPFLGINHQGMYIGQSFDVIGSFFRITFVENPGMAFGYDPGNSWKFMISLFTLIVSIGVAVYLWYIRNHRFVLRFSIALILGGAIGNLIDRMFYGVFYDYAPLFYGKVVDFFNVDFFDFSLFGRTYDRWPIFNIADAAVTVGVVILLFFYNSADDKKKEEENAAEEAAVSPDGLEGKSSPGELSDGDNTKDADGEDNRRESINI